MQLYKLFSTPVFKSDPYQFSEEEINLITKEKQNTMDNLGKNVSSKDTYVLNKLSKINDFCKNQLEIYTREILKIVPDIQFYITQSWINYNEKDTYHQPHYHPNSLISGVLAIQNPNNVNFILNRPLPTKLFDNLLAIYDYSELNDLNSQRTTVSIPTGTLLLFPSKIWHEVAHNKFNEERITLAFNSFIKGRLGGPKEFLGELII
jgi:uncharacterized protein (TIGR02466 family)